MKVVEAPTALVHALRLILPCTLVLTMVSCSRMSEWWKEEVRQSDGRLIVVKSTAKGTLTRDIAIRATGWKPKETTLRIAQMDGAAKPPVWRSHLIPVVMDYDRLHRHGRSWPLTSGATPCTTWTARSCHTGSCH